MARRTQTRERLVRTAAELFWRHGYAHTGVNAIMKRARATSGSFYHFFPTKDDLLLAVLDEVARRIETEVLESAEVTSAVPEGRLAQLVRAYRGDTVPGATSFGLPVGALVCEFGPELDEARIKVAEIHELVVARVASWFTDAAGSRAIVASARQLASLIVATLEGAALMALAKGSAAPIDSCAEQLRGIVEQYPPDGSARGEEMPPPDVAAADGVDWKAW